MLHVGLSVFIQSSNFHNHFFVMGPLNYLFSTKPGSCTRIILMQFEDSSKETMFRIEGKRRGCNIENHNNGNLQKNANNYHWQLVAWKISF